MVKDSSPAHNGTLQTGPHQASAKASPAHQKWSQQRGQMTTPDPVRNHIDMTVQAAGGGPPLPPEQSVFDQTDKLRQLP